MHSFGLVETNMFDEAEKTARKVSAPVWEGSVHPSHVTGVEGPCDHGPNQPHTLFFCGVR